MKKTLSLVVILTLIITSCLFSAQAASKVKINKKKATIKVGQTVKLKVKNTKKKAKWSSSNKQVATVSKKGKVTGKKTGKATIIAKAGKKKYKCKIRVVANILPNNAVQNPTVRPTEPTTTKPEETTEPVNPADWNYEYTESGTVVIKGYKGNQTKITIPGEINGAQVTAMNGNGYSGVEEIIIPDHIYKVSYGNFSDCTSLRSVTLSNKLLTLPESLFRNCTNLVEVKNIPTSLTSIEDYTFCNCENLSSFQIPNSVKSIEYSAFEYSGLKSINIPMSVESISCLAFGNCKNLTKVYIENGVKKISDAAFNGCTKLKDVVLPNSLKELGDMYDSWQGGVFSNCSSLQRINIPYGVETIGSSAFYGCTSLSSITIPNSVTAIGGSAFEGCTSLSNITIPNSVTEIGFGYVVFEAGTIIKGSKNSYAETYAKEKGFNFIAID